MMLDDRYAERDKSYCARDVKSCLLKSLKGESNAAFEFRWSDCADADCISLNDSKTGALEGRPQMTNSGFWSEQKTD